MQASQRWKEMVEAEHAQSERMREDSPPDDHWQTSAHHFRADPRRSDDPLVERLLQEVGPHHTLLDVGAGAGRLALPLALRCREVIAVEPSPSMASLLLQLAAEHDIHNVSLVQAKWEEAEVDPADIVLCAHVLYTAGDIVPFVRKLEIHGRNRVLIVLFRAPPQTHIYPLWKQVHGEDRLPLPGLPQLRDVLRELDIDARVEMLPQRPRPGFDSSDEAMDELGRRLFLGTASPKRDVLERLLPDILEDIDGQLRIKGTRPLEAGLVSWRPNL